MTNIAASLIGALIAATPVIAGSPPPTSWEITGQFRTTCPDKPGSNFWNYGTKQTPDGPFFPLTIAFSQFSQPAPKIQGCSSSASPSFPFVGQNQLKVNNTFDGGAGPLTYPARGIVLHPGPSGELAIVRFTAPVAAQYTVSGRFYGIDGNGSQTTTNVAIYRSGSVTPIFTGVIDLPNNVSYASFTSKTFPLAANERLDFQVGFGLGPNANNGFDSTGLHGVIEQSVLGCGGNPSTC